MAHVADVTTNAAAPRRRKTPTLLQNGEPVYEPYAGDKQSSEDDGAKSLERAGFGLGGADAFHDRPSMNLIGCGEHLLWWDEGISRFVEGELMGKGAANRGVTALWASDK